MAWKLRSAFRDCSHPTGCFCSSDHSPQTACLCRYALAMSFLDAGIVILLMWSASWLFVRAAQRKQFFSARRQRRARASRRAISAAQRRLTLTPFCSEKRKNAHFPFASSSFCLEPKGKVVQLLEICPAVPKVRAGSVVHQVLTTLLENDRYTGLSAPLAVTPRRHPEHTAQTASDLTNRYQTASDLTVTEN